jgi:Probable cobalt transporter subunit (CbtB)
MDSVQAAPPQPRTGVLVGLLGLSLFGFYVLALDQGWLLSLVQGARAFDLNFIHEAVHDARHVAGFPCH